MSSPDFVNKTVLVTGGSRGIGRTAAIPFRSNNARFPKSDWSRLPRLTTIDNILQPDTMDDLIGGSR